MLAPHTPLAHQPFISDAVKKAVDDNIGSIMKDIVNGANAELLKVRQLLEPITVLCQAAVLLFDGGRTFVTLTM